MKKKYIIISILTVILSAICAVNISLGIKAREYVTYTAEITQTEHITNVVINNTKIPLTRFLNEDNNIEIIEQEIKDRDGEKENVLSSKSISTIKIVTSVIDNVMINYSGDTSNINVYLDGQEQEFDGSLYMNTKNIIETIKMSFEWYFIVVFIVSLPVMFALLYYITLFMNKLKDNNVKLWQVALFILSIFILYFCLIYTILYVSNFVGIFIILICLFLGIYYLKNVIKSNIESIYLFIATIMGMTMLFVVPPFNVPDEAAHYIKSFETTYINNNDEGYTHLPVSIENFIYKYDQGSHTITTKYNVKNYFSDMFENGDYNVLSENVRSYVNTKTLSVLPYIPSMLVIFIGRIINASPLILLLMGKFINLAITIFVCYMAIKNIPCFKRIMFIIALFPMFLHQASAINMDWLTNLTTIAIISFIIGLKYKDGKIDKKNMALISILAIILAYCKFGYFPVLLLILLVPNNKFENKKQAIIFKSLFIIIPSILSYLQNSSLGGMASDRETPYYTLEYALSHPFNVIKIYFQTAFDRFPLDIFRGMFDGFGVSTQWHNSLELYILIALYVILIATSGNDEPKFKWLDRVIMVIPALMIIFIIFSAMFFNWTKYGAYVIDGLQPRYFIPAISILVLALSNNLIKINVKNQNLIFSYSLILVYLLTFLTIVLGFY